METDNDHHERERIYQYAQGRGGATDGKGGNPADQGKLSDDGVSGKSASATGSGTGRRTAQEVPEMTMSRRDLCAGWKRIDRRTILEYWLTEPTDEERSRPCTDPEQCRLLLDAYFPNLQTLEPEWRDSYRSLLRRHPEYLRDRVLLPASAVIQ